jgi:hypothetical protein
MIAHDYSPPDVVDFFRRRLIIGKRRDGRSKGGGISRKLSSLYGRRRRKGSFGEWEYLRILDGVTIAS